MISDGCVSRSKGIWRMRMVDAVVSSSLFLPFMLLIGRVAEGFVPVPSHLSTTKRSTFTGAASAAFHHRQPTNRIIICKNDDRTIRHYCKNKNHRHTSFLGGNTEPMMNYNDDDDDDDDNTQLPALLYAHPRDNDDTPSSSSSNTTTTENFDFYGCVEEETTKWVDNESKTSRRRGRKLRRRLRNALEQMMVSVVPGITRGNSPPPKQNNDSVNNDDGGDGGVSVVDNGEDNEHGLANDLFESMDEDRDGYLSETEILSSGYGLTMNDVTSLDRDQDGKVSREELVDAVTMTSLSPSSTNQDIVDEIGDALGQLEPLERQEMRLEGFEPYVLVSVLTAEGSFGMISEMNDIEWDTASELMASGSPMSQVILSIDWLSIGMLISAAMSTVAGMYATTVFALCILYGKTALGLSREAAYYKFMAATGLQRYRAFQAFSLALLTFSISVLLLVAKHSLPPMRLPIAIVSILVLYFGYEEYNNIVVAARPIFAPTQKVESKSHNEGDDNSTVIAFD